MTDTWGTWGSWFASTRRCFWGACNRVRVTPGPTYPRCRIRRSNPGYLVGEIVNPVLAAGPVTYPGCDAS